MTAAFEPLDTKVVPPEAWRLPVPGIVLALFVSAYIVQFSSAWIWVNADISGVDLQGIQPFGTPFRYAVWLSIFSITVLHFATLPVQPYFRSLAPLLPFWAMGIVSTMAGGVSIGSAVQALIFWLMMASAATVVGLTMPPRLLIKTLAYTFGTIIFLSIVLALAAPNIGQVTDAEGTLWRGTFVFKNTFGVASMWALAIAFLAMPTIGRRRAAVLMAMAVVSLWFSGSKGSLVVAIAAFGYFGLLSILIRARVSSSLGAGLLIGGVVVAALLTLNFWIPVTEALGRDPTLTGRTVIWSVYLERVMEAPILGEGPTSFSSVSAITETLFYQLSEFGSIRTPHNMYIAVFGDGGVIGLVTYVCGLFYLAFVAPFTMRSETSRATALAAFMILVGGTVETRGVYGSSLDFFILLTLRALAVRWSYLSAGRFSMSRSFGAPGAVGPSPQLVSRPA